MLEEKERHEKRQMKKQTHKKMKKHVLKNHVYMSMPKYQFLVSNDIGSKVNTKKENSIKM